MLKVDHVIEVFEWTAGYSHLAHLLQRGRLDCYCSGKWWIRVEVVQHLDLG